MMTPLQINMMLHYYASAEPYAQHDPAHANSPAVARQRQQLCMWGLLMADNKYRSGYYPTENGFAYVARLQAMSAKASDDPAPLCLFCNTPQRTITTS